ncbi:hypothetical protein [Streptomyces sp. NPDC017448]|uniref:hypothetical protein n=1 Tax=Streptomyces sp. NPDC017448 TaxID=3364996 RepID=UPI0037A0DE71
MTDTFIGIDQSYGGFSIAVWVPAQKQLEFHLKAFPAKKYGQGVDRLRAVSENILDVFQGIYEKDLEIKHICMEGYARNSKFRREEAGELASMVKLTLSVATPKPVSYPTVVAPTQLKVFVTGSHRASKEDMIAGVKEKWGVETKNDNNADSLGLAHIAEALHTSVTHSPFEDLVLSKLKRHTEQFPVVQAA